MASYDVTSNDELDSRVRSLTQYADDPDELSSSDLNELRNTAKSRLRLKTGSDAWYSDRGLGQALVFITAILSKSAVENYSVSSWSIGDQTIDVQGAGDETQAQFQEWNQMVVEGLQQSNAATSTGLTPSNSSSYIG